MFFYNLKVLRRSPFYAMAILVFAIVISAALCGLQAANDREAEAYENVLDNIPVKLTVTNLSGTQNDDLDIMYIFYDVMISDTHFHSFADLVTNVNAKGAIGFIAEEDTPGVTSLVGITTIGIVRELSSDVGCEIEWYDGYDETIFSSNENYILVPESLSHLDKITMHFSYVEKIGNFSSITHNHSETFTVVGKYSSVSTSEIYTSFQAFYKICACLSKPCEMKSLSAELADNRRLDEFKERLPYWFAEPNPLGEPTHWGYLYKEYPNALDIDDNLLVTAKTTLESSIKTNRICTTLIFALSSVAGFLVGFLVIRSRKKDIALLCAMGAPDSWIYLGFVVEQMICVVSGIIIGGAAFLYPSAFRLLLFAVFYFVTVSVSMIIFMRRNKMTTLKEDE